METIRSRRRGSTARRIGALAILGVGLLTGCAGQGGGGVPESAWFGGYVNVTSVPRYEFESQDTASQGRTVLSFVVSDTDDACTPSWGGYYGLDDAAEKLDLDTRIDTLRSNGGDVVVSFGGQSGTELATGCEDADELYEAYSAVVERYDLDAVDLDIEMDDLQNSDAGSRRAEAVARLQEERPDDDPLEVWVTLPVGTEGLDEQSRLTVAQLLEAGVDLAGVNLMTMNYGDAKDSDQSSYDASVAAARAAQTQVKELYGSAGQELSDEQAWQHLGLTPMIGRNDVDGEVFDLAAAQQLNEFAREQGVGRLSLWSLDRDRACTTDESAAQWASGVCSGVEQQDGDFTRALAEQYPR
ncbi:glycosyl hydrolase [Kocuria sp. cx-116]|uniref:chitinase n=1 Tax=Kocuria sp. cx-116 TaxID=2771378 RepID=UPI0016830914|nr:chitinase [Kocuria sp. cx-116]MBD2762252.1 glycosyl hydrolase [Kocuria sp. cx-116]